MRRIIALALGAALLVATVPVVAAGTYPVPARVGPRTGASSAAAPRPPRGRPPAGMTTVIVTMRRPGRPAAPSGAAREPPGCAPSSGRCAPRAAASQVPLLRLPRGQAALGRVARQTSFWVFNGLSVTATPARHRRDRRPGRRGERHA